MAQVYRQLGYGITTDKNLIDYINNSDILRPHFRGIFTNVKDLSKVIYRFGIGDFALMNRDVHWTTIYKDPKNGKLMEYNSFGRDIWGPNFKNVPIDNPQKAIESDCGQRTLRHLEKVLQ